MTRSSLEDVSGLPDPLLTYNFDLILPTIPGYNGPTRSFTIKCQSAVLPGMQLEQVTTGLHGVEVNHAGRQIWSKTFPATVLETRDGTSRGALRQWMRHARNNGANKGAHKMGAGGYAITGTILVYDDVPNVVNEIKVYGLWCMNLDDVQMDGSQSGVVMAQATFSYDYTIETNDKG